MVKNYLIHFLIFGCLGITVEIFFTAIIDWLNKEGSLKLEGYSYVWMFPIYGLAAFAMSFVWGWLLALPIFLRILLYVLGIFAIEFVAGWLLERIIGKCPWHYTSPWAVKGYIRLDYAPFWAIFGLLLEQTEQVLQSGFPLY